MKKLYFLLIIILLICCKKKDNNQYFSFIFSLESIGNYKTVINIRSDTTFTITEINYFLNRHEKNHKENVVTGLLSDQEFKTIKSYLNKNNLFNLEDHYGFVNANNDNTIVCTLELQCEKSGKFIVINLEDVDANLPNSLRDFVISLSTILDKHLKNG